MPAGGYNTQTDTLVGYGTDKANPGGVIVENTTIGEDVPKPGNFTTLTAETLTLTEPVMIDVQTPITAFATGGQTSATQLVGQYCLVTTCATAFDSVKLAAAATGKVQTVKNIGAATLSVFPTTGDAINALAANLSIDVPVGSEITFTAIDGTTWETKLALYVTAGTTQTGGIVIRPTASTGNTITTITNALQAAARTYTIPDAGASASFLMTAGTQVVLGSTTFTNSLLKLLGSSTGVQTFTSANAGASNFTTTIPAVTGVLATTTGANLFYADISRCTAPVTKNASAAYANVTGLSQVVVPGTYAFVCKLPSTVASGTGGIKYAFNYTTTALTSIEATGRGFTSAAVAVQHTTTTTTQTDLFTQAAVVIYTELTGTMVVATGGTIDLQMAQNTSNASDTIALLGASMEFVRIA